MFCFSRYALELLGHLNTWFLNRWFSDPYFHLCLFSRLTRLTYSTPHTCDLHSENESKSKNPHKCSPRVGIWTHWQLEGNIFFLSSRVYLVFLVLHHLGEAIGHPKIQLALITDSDFESRPHGSRNVASET